MIYDTMAPNWYCCTITRLKVWDPLLRYEIYERLLKSIEEFTPFKIIFENFAAPDDLSVKRGDWIYADLNNQTVDGWLW